MQTGTRSADPLKLSICAACRELLVDLCTPGEGGAGDLHARGKEVSVASDGTACITGESKRRAM